VRSQEQAQKETRSAKTAAKLKLMRKLVSLFYELCSSVNP
jgi:hypothetical protein